MSKLVHKFNNGYALLVEQTDNVYQTLANYDEYATTVISRSDSACNNDLLRNHVPKKNEYYEHLALMIEEPYEMTKDGFSVAVKRYKEAQESVQGVANLPDVDFNKISQQIWAKWNDWHKGHIKYLNKADNLELSEFFEAVNYQTQVGVFSSEFFNQVQNYVTRDYKGCFEEPEEVPNIAIQEAEQELNSLKAQAIETLTNYQVSDVESLDKIISYYLFLYFDADFNTERTFNWSLEEVDVLLKNSTIDFYVDLNPYVNFVKVEYCYDNASVISCQFYENSDAIIFAENEKCFESILQSINLYFKDEWYSASAYYLVSETDKYKYQNDTGFIYLEEAKSWAVDLIDSCCGFTSEKDAINNFEYLSKEQPLKYSLDYKTLANTKTV